MKPEFKSGAFLPRYSNYDPNTVGAPASGDIGLGGPSSNSGGSSSSSVDWGGTVGSILTNLSDVAKSIWGRSDGYRAESYYYMLQSEKKTNTVLWVVIGLVLALGVVLVIRRK